MEFKSQKVKNERKRKGSHLSKKKKKKGEKKHRKMSSPPGKTESPNPLQNED